MKLTPARRKALQWICDNEPVGSFPCDGTAPQLKFVKKLCGDGLVERVGKDGASSQGIFGGFTLFALTSAGRSALPVSPSEGGGDAQG